MVGDVGGMLLERGGGWIRSVSWECMDAVLRCAGWCGLGGYCLLAERVDGVGVVCRRFGGVVMGAWVLVGGFVRDRSSVG